MRARAGSATGRAGRRPTRASSRWATWTKPIAPSGSRGCIPRARPIRRSPAIEATLARVQNDLFDLGADLCLPPAAERGAGRGAARRGVAGRGARARHRRAERESRAAALVHPAGWNARRRPRCITRAPSAGAPSAASSRSPRPRARAVEPRRARLHQPSVGLSLRRRARGQRLRRGQTSCGRPAPTSPDADERGRPHNRHRRDQRHVDGRHRRGPDPERRRGAGRARPGCDISLSRRGWLGGCGRSSPSRAEAEAPQPELERDRDRRPCRGGRGFPATASRSRAKASLWSGCTARPILHRPGRRPDPTALRRRARRGGA